MTKLLQFTAFKLCWFGLILIPQWALWPALVYLGWSLWRLQVRSRIAVVGISGLGMVMDSLLLQSGTFSFIGSAVIPPWLMVLWGCFSLILVQVLADLLRHWWLAAIVGAVTGPLAYWGGAALGGQLIFADTTMFLLTLALCWGLLLALVVATRFLWSEKNESKIVAMQ